MIYHGWFLAWSGLTVWLRGSCDVTGETRLHYRAISENALRAISDGAAGRGKPCWTASSISIQDHSCINLRV